MDEKYRLIFRGELLDGQHRAVVKRRLSEALKLKDGQVEKLFSGQPVVVKREVDRAAAARYQALFKEAGAQLRVKAEAGTEAAVSESAEKSAEKTARPEPSAKTAGSAPVTEGRPSAAADIEAPDFKVQSTWFPPPETPQAEIDAPDYSVAAVGSDLADKTEAPVAAVAEVNFDLAEVGADLLTERRVAPVAAVASVDFEVAEVGADIGIPRPSEIAEAPDVSHIALVEP